MLTMQDIRARYPHPCVGPTSPQTGNPLPLGSYCVGGACVLAVNRLWYGQTLFPNAAELADALRQLQPRLLRVQALYAASGIIAANDAGRFDDAWALVAQALTNDGASTRAAISKR